MGPSAPETIMSNDETKEFLDSLPELKEGNTYKFKCYPGIKCFNACCNDLDMVLTPYDILRMRKAVDKNSIDFLRIHTIGHRAPDTNFPTFKFRMTDSAARTCSFVSDKGCAIYEDRPGACRMYPLGRATRPDGKGGVKEQFSSFRKTTAWASRNRTNGPASPGNRIRAFRNTRPAMTVT